MGKLIRTENNQQAALSNFEQQDFYRLFEDDYAPYDTLCGLELENPTICNISQHDSEFPFWNEN